MNNGIFAVINQIQLMIISGHTIVFVYLFYIFATRFLNVRSLLHERQVS